MICVFFVCCTHLNILVARNRKYAHKKLREKYETSKDSEKEMSNKNVTAKYGSSKDTLSTWAKNKGKRLDLLEKGRNTKRQKLRTGNFEMVDPAIFNWSLNMENQNVP